MEAGWFKLNGIFRDGELPVVVCLSFRRRYIADEFEQAVVVELRHPFEGSDFHGFHGLPMPKLYAVGSSERQWQVCD